MLLGIGSGGFPDTPFWQALGVPGRDRGRRTDDALRVLPSLVAGEAAVADGVELRFGPAATMPPVLVGGNSDVALRRTIARGDGWLPSLISPAALTGRAATLRELAAAGRPVPGACRCPAATRARIAGHLHAYAEAGAERVITGPHATGESEWLRQADVIAEGMALL